MAFLFSSAHFSVSVLANISVKACSSVADRFMFMALHFLSKLLFKLRFVGFLGACGSNRGSMLVSQRGVFIANCAHGYAHSKAFSKASTATAFPLRLWLHYKAVRVGSVKSLSDHLAKTVK